MRKEEIKEGQECWVPMLRLPYVKPKKSPEKLTAKVVWYNGEVEMFKDGEYVCAISSTRCEVCSKKHLKNFISLHLTLCSQTGKVQKRS